MEPKKPYKIQISAMAEASLLDYMMRENLSRAQAIAFFAQKISEEIGEQVELVEERGAEEHA